MITLIGKDLAKKGQEFVFLGPADECETCRFKSSCVGNLELNRKYVVVDVKENEQKCPIHAEGIVIPVEVDRAKIDLLTTSKSIFEGSTFTYNAQIVTRNVITMTYVSLTAWLKTTSASFWKAMENIKGNVRKDINLINSL